MRNFAQGLGLNCNQTRPKRLDLVFPVSGSNSSRSSFMLAFRNVAFAVALALMPFGSTTLSSALAEMSMEIGGAPMYPSKDIVENLSNSKEHTKLMAAVRTAELTGTLQGEGPFTVFAPVDKAFEKLPKGMFETLSNPENKAALAALLTYHVIPGKISAADFIAAIKKGGGEASYKTLEGEELRVRQDGRRLEIIDAREDKSFVITSDVSQKNGIIHVIDAVLQPKS
jgi:uncharacterized surface protein with fasciclin (FAS1) repeats